MNKNFSQNLNKLQKFKIIYYYIIDSISACNYNKNRFYSRYKRIGQKQDERGKKAVVLAFAREEGELKREKMSLFALSQSSLKGTETSEKGKGEGEKGEKKGKETELSVSINQTSPCPLLFFCFQSLKKMKRLVFFIHSELIRLKRVSKAENGTNRGFSFRYLTTFYQRNIYQISFYRRYDKQKIKKILKISMQINFITLTIQKKIL